MRIRWCVCALVLAAVLAAWVGEPTGAFGDESAFILGKRAYYAARWDQAEQALLQALAGAASPQRRAQAQLFLALARHQRGAPGAMVDDGFRLALRIDPNLRFPPGEALTVERRFLQIRRELLAPALSAPKNSTASDGAARHPTGATVAALSAGPITVASVPPRTPVRPDPAHGALARPAGATPRTGAPVVTSPASAAVLPTRLETSLHLAARFPAQARGGWRRWAPWLATGIAAAAATTGVYFGLRAASASESLVGAETAARIANIAFPVAGAAAASAIGLFLWRGLSKESPRTRLTIGPTGVSLSGGF